MHRALAFALALLAAPAASAQIITSAAYTEPTNRYPHGVLGDDEEWGALVIQVDPGQGALARQYTLRLPQEMVFEDLAPRLVDLDGDGGPEIIVVQSHQRLGGRLVVVGLNASGVPEVIAATPHIGQRYRWLAPVGVADFDADGTLDIALVDRPHLARQLHVYRYGKSTLESFASIGPVTNHRIGDAYIEGGVRTCDGPAEMIVLDASWSTILRIDWHDGQLRRREIAPYAGRDSVAAALACD